MASERKQQVGKNQDSSFLDQQGKIAGKLPAENHFLYVYNKFQNTETREFQSASLAYKLMVSNNILVARKAVIHCPAVQDGFLLGTRRTTDYSEFEPSSLSRSPANKVPWFKTMREADHRCMQLLKPIYLDCLKRVQRKAHVKSLDLENRWFCCKNCNQFIRSPKAFLDHKKSKCRRLLDSVPSLKARAGKVVDRHGAHKGETPFECDKCPASFNAQKFLSVHSAKEHNPKKPEAHSEQKSEGKRCRFCSKAFSTRAYRKIHERIHTDEKPYACKLCNYTTTCSGNLTAHGRVHTGEKPFKCDLCEYSCTSSASFKKHRARAHINLTSV